ncbi:MAG: glycosyltransferase family 9 protein [Planctomycetes bacterium]|nr:glycosyltransferase family 9 protein [Planctomycetota bacterium]
MNVPSRLVELCKVADARLGGALARRAQEGPRRVLPDDVHDVLVVRLWGLGNLTLLAPQLAANAQRRVRLLTLACNAPFARAHLPPVELLTVPAPYAPGFVAEVLRVARALHLERPDVVVDLEQFLRLPLWLARRGGAPCVGLDTPGQGRAALLDIPVAYDPTRHVADTFAALFAAAGLDTARGPGALRVPSDAGGRLVRALRLDGRPLVLLHPGSGDHFPGRRWPPERYGRLAHVLAHAHDARVLVTGSPRERALVRAVVAESSGCAEDLAGRLAAHELVALLARADLLVTNDTGPLHMADAVGTRAVALYGPNTPHRYGPRLPGSVGLFADLPCSPCLDDRSAKHSSCRHFACMDALDVPLVARACARVLDDRRTTRDACAARAQLPSPRGPDAAASDASPAGGRRAVVG